MSKKGILIASVLGFLIISFIVVFAISSGGPDEEYSTVIASRGNLNQTVSGTGTVVSNADIDLNFKTTGRIDEEFVEVGDEVERGDFLIKLENEELDIQVQKAEAVLALAKANLEQRIVGASRQDINVSKAKVEEAEAALKKAEVELSNLESTRDQRIKQAELDNEKAQLAYDNAKISLDNIETTTQEAVVKASIVKDGMLSTLNNIEDTNIQALEDSYDNALIIMESNLVSMAGALTDMDNILGVDNTAANDSFENNLGALKKTTVVDSENAYNDASIRYAAVKAVVGPLNEESAYIAIEDTIEIVRTALDSVADALEKVKLLLDNTITNSNLTQTNLATKKSAIDTTRGTINTAISSLQTSKQAILSAKLSTDSSYITAKTNYDRAAQDLIETEASAKSQVDTAKANVDTTEKNSQSAKEVFDKLKIDIDSQIKSAEAQVEVSKAAFNAARASLELKTAPPRTVDLAGLRAQVREAQAAYDMVNTQLEDSIIKAPVEGIITAINYNIGEQTALTTSAVSLLGKNQFQVEVDIPEADIAKIELADEVNITLDAFGEDIVFKATIASINPAETIIEGVVYYKVKCEVIEMQEKKLKKGMTANVIIRTDMKENVLMIPQRAVFDSNGMKMVNVLRKKKLEAREVKVGIRGDDGLIEILEGLTEGEEVVTFIKIKK